MQKKKRIFMLSPGPKYNLEHAFKERCEKLSESFYGVVVTSGPEYSRHEFGDFLVVCIKDPFVKSFVSTICFTLIGLWFLLSGVCRRDPFKLFITYDPLKTGLVGAVVTACFSTKLVVEVNGDYTQDVIYEVIKNPIKRKLKKRAMLLVERFVLNRAQGVKLLYEQQIDVFKPLAKKPLITTFPNYVNADHFENHCEEKEILTIGFPLKIKGIDILIAAFKKMSDEFPDWKLKILGYYPDKTELNSLIDGHPKIYHHPPVDPADIPTHIGRCGIFVLASRTEAMGRVLVESMAVGKPRIGSNSGGIPTVIDDEVDGILFQSEDINELAIKLKLLVNDNRLRASLGEAAKNRYQKEFVTDRYFERLNAFYSTIAD